MTSNITHDVKKVRDDIKKCVNKLQKEEWVDVKHAHEDADVDIVQSTCAISTTCPVIVVGDDTDLLIHHV